MDQPATLLLRLPVGLLPADQRAQFVEEARGNLSVVSSRKEWIAYLATALLQMPWTAWVYRTERRRGPNR
jgi:hypothetical protein